jgi:hypothetical protein
MTSKTISCNFSFNSKMTLVILFFVLLLSGCTKTDTVILNDLDFYKSLLAGSETSTDFQKVWKLDSLIVNGLGIPLTSAQLKYYKTFKRNGIYLDFDGYGGKWDITSPTSLEIKITNNANPLSLSYQLIELNSFQLQIEAVFDNETYQYHFKIQ